jgi:Inner membrane protein YgaP-like, transmembrane domain
MSIRSLYRRNVGGLDRGIRLVLGAPLAAAGLFVAGGTQGVPVGIILALVGLVGVLTGITGRCPLYVPFGISTARLPTSRPASVYQE